MSSLKVTVLVAVYQAEAYLSECLDSLINQTYGQLQVICVDDYSTDGSLELLRDYERRDNRIEVYTLSENHGQAYARNVALSHAKGNLVCFLDADDWFAPDAIQQAVDTFLRYPDSDCVLFQVNLVEPKGSHLYPLPSFTALTGREAFEMSLDWQIHGVYMVRADIHRRYPYDDTCRSYSDDNTTRIHFYVSRYVRQCQGVYNYRQLPTSVSHQVSERRFDFLRANESMKRQLIDLGVDEVILRRWEVERMLVLVDVYMFYHCHGRELEPKARQWGLSEMKRVWQNIDTRLLDSPELRKFGHLHLSSWLLFRLQEWIYFTLRGLQGKNC